MAAVNPNSRDEALARLAQSRAEIRKILEPKPRAPREQGSANQAAGENFSQFPRSRTMRLLMNGRALGTMGAMVGGLMLARPALAFRLLRMLPTNAVARMLLVKAVTAFRARR